MPTETDHYYFDDEMLASNQAAAQAYYAECGAGFDRR